MSPQYLLAHRISLRKLEHVYGRWGYNLSGWSDLPIRRECHVVCPVDSQHLHGDLRRQQRDTASPGLESRHVRFGLRNPGDHRPCGLHLQRLVHCSQRRNPGDGGYRRRHRCRPHSLRPVDSELLHGDLRCQRRHCAVPFRKSSRTVRLTEPWRPPAHTGFNFSGWFTASSGGTQVTTATIVATDGDHPLRPVEHAAKSHRDLQRQRRNGHGLYPDYEHLDCPDAQHVHTDGMQLHRLEHGRWRRRHGLRQWRDL